MFGVLNDANQKATIELDGQLNKLNINERSEALVSKVCIFYKNNKYIFVLI